MDPLFSSRPMKGDQLFGPFRKVASPFRPTSRRRRGSFTTTMRRRDVGAVPVINAHPLSLGPLSLKAAPVLTQVDPMLQPTFSEDSPHLMYSRVDRGLCSFSFGYRRCRCPSSLYKILITLLTLCYL